MAIIVSQKEIGRGTLFGRAIVWCVTVFFFSSSSAFLSFLAFLQFSLCRLSSLSFSFSHLLRLLYVSYCCNAILPMRWQQCRRRRWTAARPILFFISFNTMGGCSIRICMAMADCWAREWGNVERSTPMVFWVSTRTFWCRRKRPHCLCTNVQPFIDSFSNVGNNLSSSVWFSGIFAEEITTSNLLLRRSEKKWSSHVSVCLHVYFHEMAREALDQESFVGKRSGEVDDVRQIRHRVLFGIMHLCFESYWYIFCHTHKPNIHCPISIFIDRMKLVSEFSHISLRRNNSVHGIYAGWQREIWIVISPSPRIVNSILQRIQLLASSFEFESVLSFWFFQFSSIFFSKFGIEKLFAYENYSIL